MELFTPQLFLGWMLGVVMLGVYFIVFTPFAGGWARNKIKELLDANNRINIKLQSIMKGSEHIYQRWQRCHGEIKALRERIRFEVNKNADLSDTIIVLGEEKSDLQELRNRQYVELDILKTQITKLTSPAYAKGEKAINENGKIINTQRSK